MSRPPVFSVFGLGEAPKRQLRKSRGTTIGEEVPITSGFFSVTEISGNPVS
jgi:hypothetical protein